MEKMDLKIEHETKNNIILFHTDEITEIIKLCNNGDIYIRGKLVENDKEVVNGMRDFLNLPNSNKK